MDTNRNMETKVRMECNACEGFPNQRHVSYVSASRSGYMVTLFSDTTDRLVHIQQAGLKNYDFTLTNVSSLYKPKRCLFILKKKNKGFLEIKEAGFPYCTDEESFASSEETQMHFVFIIKAKWLNNQFWYKFRFIFWYRVSIRKIWTFTSKNENPGNI